MRCNVLIEKKDKSKVLSWAFCLLDSGAEQ